MESENAYSYPADPIKEITDELNQARRELAASFGQPEACPEALRVLEEAIHFKREILGRLQRGFGLAAGVYGRPFDPPKTDQTRRHGSKVKLRSDYPHQSGAKRRAEMLRKLRSRQRSGL